MSDESAENPAPPPGCRLRFGTPVTALAALVSLPLAAQAVIPLPELPLTLQTLGVLVVAGCFRPLPAFLVLAAYLALGAAGLPIFAQGGRGIDVLTGVRGGFLLAFPIAAAAASNMMELLGLSEARTRSEHYRRLVGPMIFGSGLILMLGLGRWGALDRSGFELDRVLQPLLLPALVKSVLAMLVSTELLRAFGRKR